MDLIQLQLLLGGTITFAGTTNEVEVSESSGTNNNSITRQCDDLWNP